RFYFSHGSDQMRRRARLSFHQSDPMCCCRKCITPQMHRSGPRMIRLAAEDDFETTLAGYGLYDPHRQRETFKYRTLFYVKLQIAQDIFRPDGCFSDFLWIESEIANRLL